MLIFNDLHVIKSLKIKEELMVALSGLWNTIECWLFPALEEELGELSEKQQEFIRVCELCDLEKHISPYRWKYNGRKRKERLSLLKAFIAKAVHDFPTTRALIDYLENCPTLRRLCGWETAGEFPSESTFSRAFAEFAEGQLTQQVHETMIEKHYSPKIAGHVSRDSTPIHGREKPVKKIKENRTEKKSPKKRGRPRKGEKRLPPPPSKLTIQLGQTLEENLEALPTLCNVGTKRNSKGYKSSWTGYKLHLDCVDGDIPVSAILTSASLHDSQAAIPLTQMTVERITNLYDLMDSAYDAPEIHEISRSFGHVPIIDHNKRRGEKKEMSPSEKIRYNERSTAERVNSNFKDNYGGNHVRVRGDAKVMTHLMFGIIALTAKQLFNLLI